MLKPDLALFRNLFESGDVYDSDRGAADSIAVDRIDDTIADALRRYLVLADDPVDARVLGRN